MRIIVIGAVAAGTSAAAKARRNNESAEIVIYEKDSDISYSACGMPYYIGGAVSSIDELVPRNVHFFKKKYNIDIRIKKEVINIDSKNKTLQIKDLDTGEIFDDFYDVLIVATGAKAIRPNIDIKDQNVCFNLKSIDDMKMILEYIGNKKPTNITIVGSGFIGLELVDNLFLKKIPVTLIEREDQLNPHFDADVSIYIKKIMDKNMIDYRLSTTIKEVYTDKVITDKGEEIKTDMVIFAIGVKPNVELIKNCGVKIGPFGGITVDKNMKTNIDSIYACGDCIENINLVTGKPIYVPLGSTANKTGRIAGDNASGMKSEFNGILGTFIFKFFDYTFAKTGLSEKEALKAGFDILVSHNIKPNKPTYLGGTDILIKTVARKEDGLILGAQLYGKEGVDKRVDVIATAMSFKAKAADLINLDLAYAPPYSTSKDPVNYTGMIINNIVSRDLKIITAEDLKKDHYKVIDMRDKSNFELEHINNAKSMPLESLRDNICCLDKDDKIVTYCNKGITGNAAQNVLKNSGFKYVYNLSGGYTVYKDNYSKDKFDEWFLKEKLYENSCNNW